MSDEKIKFATYRGAGHVAMIWGMPIIPMLVLFGLLVFTLFFGILLLNNMWVAIPMASIIVSLMIWLKIECSIEPRAVQIRVLEFKGLLLKIKLRGSIIITSMKPRKSKGVDDVQRYFKKRVSIR